MLSRAYRYSMLSALLGLFVLGFLPLGMPQAHAQERETTT